MKTSLLTFAADPNQYNQKKGDWLQEGKGIESPSRKYFWHYLYPYTKDWSGKKLLDIGSGTGWLLHIADELGVKKAVGIEPSQVNIEASSELYPKAVSILSTFEEYETDEKFDVITSIMSFVHIKDVDSAFKKISKLLTPEGVAYLVIYDFDYARTPRFDYKIHVEDLNDEEYVVMVERAALSIADIVRTSHRFKVAAEKVDMKLQKDIPITPTQEFLEARPQYVIFENTPTHRLLIFQKIS